MKKFNALGSEDKGERLLELKGPLTVEYAAEFRNVLLDVFQGASSIRCAMEGVDAIDLAGLQLLCAAHRTAMRDGKSFSLSGPTAVMALQVAAAGFNRHVGCCHDRAATCLWLEGER